MIVAKLMAAILDSLKDPVLFADTEHVVQYMNKAAIAHYEQGEKLLDSSLLDCHNAQSQAQIVEILAAMHQGLEEQLITDDEEHRIYMRAVRDEAGRVLGYYERYEPPTKSARISAGEHRSKDPCQSVLSLKYRVHQGDQDALHGRGSQQGHCQDDPRHEDSHAVVAFGQLAPLVQVGGQTGEQP